MQLLGGKRGREDGLPRPAAREKFKVIDKTGDSSSAGEPWVVDLPRFIVVICGMMTHQGWWHRGSSCKSQGLTELHIL